MRSVVIAVAAALVAAPVHAIDFCEHCVIGIWDDPALTTTFGTIAELTPKDVYVGVLLANGDTEFAGVEFSVYGLNTGPLFLIGAEALGPRALFWGSVPAPADSSAESSGEGGCIVAWSMPVAPNVGVMRLTLYATDSVSDHMLVVKRSYPPSNGAFHTPVIVRADEPNFTAIGASSGCYVLNPSSQVATDCATILGRSPVTASTWSNVKELFR